MYDYVKKFPDHEIWRKFKNKKIHIDHYSLVDSGAGGNFLLTQFYNNTQNHKSASVEKNEFLVYFDDKTSEFNNIDQVLTFKFMSDGGQYEHHLDEIMPLVEFFYSKNTNGISVVQAHDAPHILLNALNLEIVNFTYVPIDHDTSWFTKCLAIIKNKQGKFTSDRFYKIDDIITYYYEATCRTLSKTNDIRRMEFRHDNFQKTAKEIYDAFPHILDIASPIVYMYYIDELTNNYTASVDRFVEYYSLYIQKCFDRNNRIDINNHLCSEISNIIEVQTIPYQKLFFDLDIPKTSVWQNCRRSEISLYSHKNIELVYNITDMLSDNVSKKIKNNLELFLSKLRISDAKFDN